MSVCFGGHRLKSTSFHQNLTAALAGEVQPERLCELTSINQVNTLKPLTEQAMLYRYLRSMCFADSSESSGRDSSDNN